MSKYPHADITCVPHLQGGLGNQMFQIASVFGQALRVKGTFGISEAHLDRRETLKHTKGSKNDYLGSLFSEVPRAHITNPAVYCEPVMQRGRFVLPPITTATLFVGFFQHVDYFHTYRDRVKGLFTFPTKGPIREQRNCYDLPLSNSFFIHFRGTDYNQMPFHKVIDELGKGEDNYYRRALKHYGTDRVALVTSDHHIDADILSDHRVIPLTDKDDINTLNIMRLSQYGGICANSTFSWWGGYLNDSAEKTVVVPSRWFNFDHGPRIGDQGYRFEGAVVLDP